MNEMLEGGPKARKSAGSKEFLQVFQSDNAKEIARKMGELMRVGEVVTLQGCEPVMADMERIASGRKYPIIQNWMELRATGVDGVIYIWYPKGYLVWLRVSALGFSDREFKHRIEEVDGDSPVYIIWRSK